MSYGDKVARVTIGSTIYVVYENPYQKGSYEIYANNSRFFGTFEDPKYLNENELEELIRNALRIRTGIPG